MTERKAPAGFLITWVAHSSHTHTLHHPGELGGRAPASSSDLRSVSGRAAGVRLYRDGLSGERHTGPSLALAVCRRVLQLAKKDRLWALAVNICSRDSTICPGAPGGAALLSQTSCRAPDVDLSGLCRGNEHGQDTVRAAERWDICLTHLDWFNLHSVITVRFR